MDGLEQYIKINKVLTLTAKLKNIDNPEIFHTMKKQIFSIISPALKFKSINFLACLVLLILVAACIQPLQRTTESTDQFDEIFSPDSEKVTERQLQTEIMVFADQFTMIFWQAMDEIHRSELEPEKKLMAEYNKLLYISSAMSIAAQPSPVASLLDMITFVRLGHQAVESYWIPEVYGPAGQPLLTAYQRLEDDVWQLATVVLSDSQQQTLREMIDNWRQEHPNQWYVSDIRLQDFSSARSRPVHPVSKDAQGLIDSIRKTILKVDEALLVAERALYLGERMPRLITLQTELLIDQVTENPMINQLVVDFNKFQKTSDQLGQTIKNLPENITAERMAILAGFSEMLERERVAWIQQFTEKEKSLQDLLARVHSTLELGSKNAQEYSVIFQQIDSLVESNEEKGRSDAIKDITNLLNISQEVALELNLLLENLKRFTTAENIEDIAPHLSNIVRTLGEKEEELIDRAFLLSAVLILLALAGTLLVALSYRFMAERLFHKKRSVDQK